MIAAIVLSLCTACFVLGYVVHESIARRRHREACENLKRLFDEGADQGVIGLVDQEGNIYINPRYQN